MSHRQTSGCKLIADKSYKNVVNSIISFCLFKFTELCDAYQGFYRGK